jgi:hypothetical protein
MSINGVPTLTDRRKAETARKRAQMEEAERARFDQLSPSPPLPPVETWERRGLMRVIPERGSRPWLTIGRDTLTITRGAARMIGDPPRVHLLVDATRIALIPAAADDPTAYTLTKIKSIGAASAFRSVAALGWTLGRYRVRVEDGALIAERPEDAS